jgi:hypothetical protein
VVLDSYTCELCLLQRVEMLRHLFLLCPFAKKLLDLNWGTSAILAQGRSCHNLYEEAYQPAVCYRNYYDHVMMHLERKKCMAFQ